MFRILTAAALLGLASLASAQTAVEPDKEPTGREPTSLQAADAANEALVKPFCLEHTGSRVTELYNRSRARADRRCAPAIGRAYSRRDIERIGAFDMAHALRELDPSIR